MACVTAVGDSAEGDSAVGDSALVDGGVVDDSAAAELATGTGADEFAKAPETVCDAELTRAAATLWWAVQPEIITASDATTTTGRTR